MTVFDGAGNVLYTLPRRWATLRNKKRGRKSYDSQAPLDAEIERLRTVTTERTTSSWTKHLTSDDLIVEMTNGT